MGGKGKGGGGGGGYPWWQHIKGKGGGGGKGGHDDEPSAKQPRMTQPSTELEKYVWKLDGSSYPAYKDLLGEWKEPDYTIFVDHVQGDAYAAPSMFRLRMPASVSKYPPVYVSDSTKNRAVCDFMQRVLSDLMRGGSGTDWTAKVSGGGGWSASKGGDLQIDTPCQFVLQRSSVVLTRDFVEARVTVALPAHGRTIEGKKAATVLAALVDEGKKALIVNNLDQAKLQRHIEVVEDQVHLRDTVLAELGLVAFVGNGAILPRASGADDRPMVSPTVVAFTSPPSLEVEVTLPHAGTITGMGIRKGITLIVGGGFHGKSTVLQALQSGVYDVVPGDGREFVVAEENAYKVRSEDGRPVSCTDISAFIKNLPFQLDTTKFSTKDASGSTSQAANISEGIEAGATTILVDEDTCATNFMIRDQRMQMLVASNKEPIQPFIQKIRPLFRDRQISTVLVVGGTGDFFEVADTVVCMEDYAPLDVTAKAKEIVEETKGLDQSGSASDKFPSFRTRLLSSTANGLAPAGGGKALARNLRCIQYGEEEVELTYVEQLVELGQAKALCDVLQYLGDNKYFKKLNLPETQDVDFASLLQSLDRALSDRGREGEKCGLDILSRFSNAPNGFYTKPRRLEIAAAVNRVRTAKFV
mmetsp:Transcript_23191/g.64806  ORF Transcript_23191/g.64806 Transcript_23191/m.64806 type:complete len:641 (-) Transcript_23191:76-1998(-)